MEQKTGFTYTVEGFSNVTDFAQSILLLTNLRSNKQGIIDFRTFNGSNTIRIIADNENDSYISSFIGKIEHKEKTILCIIEEHTKEDYAAFDKLVAQNKEYYIIAEND